MTKLEVNLKRLVIEHFDSLINRVDIHTEEQLEKYSSADILGKSVGNPNGPVVFKKEKIERGEDSKSVLAIPNEPTDPSLSMCDEDIIEIEGPKPTLAWDYLNTTRTQMIKKLTEIRDDALKQIETLKNKMDSVSHDEDITKIQDKMFQKFIEKRFPLLIQINATKNRYGGNIQKKNTLPFKLFLIELDFYINDSDMLVLR